MDRPSPVTSEMKSAASSELIVMRFMPVSCNDYETRCCTVAGAVAPGRLYETRCCTVPGAVAPGRLYETRCCTVPGAVATGRLRRRLLRTRPVATAPGTVPMFKN